MKKSLFTVILIFLSISLNAQINKKSGQVVYQTIKKIELNLEGELSHLANQIPKEIKKENELIFNEKASVYRSLIRNQENELENETSGSLIQIKSGSSNEFVYSDLILKTNTSQREFLSRLFLIDSKADTIQWKLTGNQKNILDINCHEAQLTGTPKRIIAWFAPSIPVPTGPDGYTGLPGLILSLDIDNGKSVIDAQSINFRDVDSKEITKPKSGKKVTQKEYEKIVEDKKRELSGNQGGGVFIIRR
jgi:GLPGLI family protein